jgi:hypothetical protein
MGDDGTIKFTKTSKINREYNTLGGRDVIEGYITAKDGTEIKAYKNASGDDRINTDCHGYTLTGGLYWVDNGAMQTFIDNTSLLSKVDTPAIGDWAVYRGPDGNGNVGVVHSGIVSSIGDSGTITITQAAGVITSSYGSAPPGATFIDNKTFTLPVDGWQGSHSDWTPEYWRPN